jgi:hypothetical protein
MKNYSMQKDQNYMTTNILKFDGLVIKLIKKPKF